MQSKNILYIVSGPSGSGKTTTLRKVMSNEVLSFTTRAIRAGEQEGVDYQFISEDRFQELVASGDIAESTTYYGSASYGITMTELLGRLDKGDAFVVVDVVGKAQLEELLASYPQYKTVSIFFRLSKDTAVKRMTRRGDSLENIQKRLKTFDEELENFYLYDYIVDNENTPDDAIKAVNFIMEIEGMKFVPSNI